MNFIPDYAITNRGFRVKRFTFNVPPLFIILHVNSWQKERP
jgi:hypothetical protein